MNDELREAMNETELRAILSNLRLGDEMEAILAERLADAGVCSARETLRRVADARNAERDLWDANFRPLAHSAPLILGGNQTVSLGDVRSAYNASMVAKAVPEYTGRSR